MLARRTQMKLTQLAADECPTLRRGYARREALTRLAAEGDAAGGAPGNCRRRDKNNRSGRLIRIWSEPDRDCRNRTCFF